MQHLENKLQNETVKKMLENEIELQEQNADNMENESIKVKKI